MSNKLLRQGDIKLTLWLLAAILGCYVVMAAFDSAEQDMQSDDVHEAIAAAKERAQEDRAALVVAQYKGGAL